MVLRIQACTSSLSASWLIEEIARDDEAGGDEIRKNLLNILDRLPNENYLSGALEPKLELAMLIDAV